MIASGPGLALAATLGLALGSYAVTSGLRLARAEPSAWGRSRCDGCRRSLSFAETVPVVSFLAVGGRCRTCDQRIDRTHLAGEVAGLLVLVCAALTGDLARTALLSLLGLTLLTTATVDQKIGRLPNLLALVIAFAGLALAALSGWPSFVIGAAEGAVFFLLLQGLRLARARFGRDPGLGAGDVKLVSALALWLGPATPWMVVAAALLGMAVALARGWPRRRLRLKFGPFIAAAAWGVGMAVELGLWPTTA